MIEEPALLTVRRPQRRPTQQQIDAFAGAPTGNIADCMRGRGAMDAVIKPVTAGPASVCGPALTCFSYPADNLGVTAALHFAQTGDVIVCANDACTSTALVGDLVCGMMKNAGVIGLVTDGMVRDVEGINSWDFPVFCGGVTPNSPAKTGPGEVGLPIEMAGRRVETGDLIVADRDGVVVVPFDEIDEVAQRLARVRKLEAAAEERIRGGVSQPGGIEELLASAQTRYVD